MKHTHKALLKAASAVMLLTGITACSPSPKDRMLEEFNRRIDLTLLPAWHYNGHSHSDRSPSYYVNDKGEEAISNSDLIDPTSEYRREHPGIYISYFSGSKTAVVDSKKIIDINGNTRYETEGIIDSSIPHLGEVISGVDNRYVERLEVAGHYEYRLIDSNGTIISEIERGFYGPISVMASKYIATDSNNGTILYRLSDGELVFSDYEDDSESLQILTDGDIAALSTYYPDLLLVKSYKKPNTKIGLYDLKNQKFQIDPEDMPYYDSYAPVDINQCIMVSKEFKYGLIDIEGNELIEPQFDDMQTDGEWYKVMVDGLRGWCDKNGNFTIEPQFKRIRYEGNYADRFLWDDWAFVYSEQGYIDRKGNVVLETPGYVGVLPFINGKALVRFDNNELLHVWIDRQGNEVSERFFLYPSRNLNILLGLL